MTHDKAEAVAMMLISERQRRERRRLVEKLAGRLCAELQIAPHLGDQIVFFRSVDCERASERMRSNEEAVRSWVDRQIIDCDVSDLDGVLSTLMRVIRHRVADNDVEES